MRKIVFGFIFVFNLYLYQVKTQTYGDPRYGETNSHKTPSSYISPTFYVRSRIKRQSHIADASGVSILNIGNGQDKHNVIDVYNTKNTRRGTTITNIGNGFGNRNEVNIQENSDGLGHPDIVLSPDIRRRTNTQQTNYKQNWYPKNSYTQKNNNRGLNNDQVDERRIGNSNGFFHNTDTNTGNRPKNINTDTNRNLPPGNSYGRYPNPQYDSNVGKELSNNSPQISDNFYRDMYDTQNTKIVINNNNVGNRFGNKDPKGFDNSDAGKFNTQNPRKVTSNNKQFDYADKVSIINIGNGHGKHNIVDVTNTQNTRRGTTTTNIGNGFGNRNEVNIQENVDGLGHPDIVLSPDIRSRTNTQQTDYEQNWYPKNSYTRKNSNRGLNNDEVSRTYTRIGKGTNNKNFIYINGVPVHSNSGVTITEAHHQRRGKATCLMTGTCHSTVIGLPTLNRKLRKNLLRLLPRLQFSKNKHQNYKEYLKILINPFLRQFIKK